MTRLIFCDVCDTLFDSNTTFDFIRFALKKERKSKRFIFTLITSRYSPLFYFLVVIGKILRRDIIRTISISLLKGFSRKQLLSSASDFYQSFLVGKKNKEVDDLLTRLRKNATLYFISASLEPIIQTIASNYQADYFASEIEYLNETTTGVLKSDLTGTKHQIAADLLVGFPGFGVTVITDNFSDRELLAMADERYVILKKNMDRNFWIDLKPEFILCAKN